MSRGLKTREPRQKVMIPARMRAGSSYVDVCIRNISSRGMMLQSASPPPTGTYVEILRAANVIVGRIVWVRERRFGVHLGERLNVPAFTNQTTPANPGLPGQDRRSPDRPRPASPSSSDISQQAERSRRLSRAMELGFVVACGAAAAGLLANVAYRTLAHPFEIVAAHVG